MERDEELYRRFLSGDTPAYDELMLRYGDSLTYYLYGSIHDLQDAEDLMIEAFARIMVKKPAIRDGCFRAYLYKTARHLGYRFAAKRNRVRAFSLEDLEEEPADSRLPEETVQSEEEKRILRRCLEKIDPAYREALWLVCFEGLSYQEAARVMGVGKKKIDNLLSRGKKALRKELEKEGITHAVE